MLLYQIFNIWGILVTWFDGINVKHFLVMVFFVEIFSKYFQKGFTDACFTSQTIKFKFPLSHPYINWCFFRLWCLIIFQVGCFFIQLFGSVKRRGLLACLIIWIISSGRELLSMLLHGIQRYLITCQWWKNKTQQCTVWAMTLLHFDWLLVGWLFLVLLWKLFQFRFSLG